MNKKTHESWSPDTLRFCTPSEVYLFSYQYFQSIFWYAKRTLRLLSQSSLNWNIGRGTGTDRKNVYVPGVGNHNRLENFGEL